MCYGVFRNAKPIQFVYLQFLPNLTIFGKKKYVLSEIVPFQCSLDLYAKYMGEFFVSQLLTLRNSGTCRDIFCSAFELEICLV